ncbi:MAG: hypothetical protein AABY22_20470, partial [Nanoarchaeota archaeon]
QRNLLTQGKKTQFSKGDKGRTRDQVSEQTRLALIERFTGPEMTEKRKKLGKKLGESGAGNEARWGKQAE